MRALAALLLAAAPAWAGDAPAAADLPEAPDYFVAAVFETTMAQSLSLACPALSFEIREASLYSGEVMGRLAQDGFDTASADGVAVSGFDEKLQALVAPFMARHGLDADTSPENACRAGFAELDAGSAVGRFLMRLDG